MLTISELAKSYGPQTLFENVSVQAGRQDRIGLVGPNGAGKSTLFSLILQTESPDAGSITLEKNATVGHLPQETAPAGDETVLELAIAITPEIADLQKKIKAAESEHPPRTMRLITTTTSTPATINWAAINSNPGPNKFSPA